MKPEIRTERPDVAAAASTEARLRASRRTLLASPLEVEHRVVDADRESDQQDDRRNRVVHRQHLARQRQQPDRRQHRRQAEQERDPRGDQRPERQQQDHQRHRERDRARLQQILAELLVDRLVRASTAELRDRELRTRALRVRDRRQDRLDLVLGVFGLAADVELDQRRMPVARYPTSTARRKRRIDVGHVWLRLQPPDYVLHGGVEPRARRRQRRALNEHQLLRRLLELVVEDPLDTAGLTRPRFVHRQRVCSHHMSERERHEDERQPAENGRLPVPRAPTARARSEILPLNRACPQLPPTSSRSAATIRLGRQPVKRFERQPVRVLEGTDAVHHGSCRLAFPGNSRPAAS